MLQLVFLLLLRAHNMSVLAVLAELAEARSELLAFWDGGVDKSLSVVVLVDAGIAELASSRLGVVNALTVLLAEVVEPLEIVRELAGAAVFAALVPEVGSADSIPHLLLRMGLSVVAEVAAELDRLLKLL